MKLTLVAAVCAIGPGCAGLSTHSCLTDTSERARVLASVSPEERKWADSILIEQCSGCHVRTFGPGELMPPSSVVDMSDAQLRRRLARHLAQLKPQFKLLDQKASFSDTELDVLAKFMRYVSCGGESAFHLGDVSRLEP